MDDDAVTALEAAIADLGTLLVQMDKFRTATSDDARALRAAALAIGDRARRAHRRGTLDGALAAELDADVVAVRATLEAWLAEVRASPLYRGAVDALGGGDDARLRASLETLFADVRIVEAPAELFHAVDWQRRGRPRGAAEVAAAIAELEAGGLPSERDATQPGVDPELPGVILQTTPPLGAPVYVVLQGTARPTWVLELPSGDVVAPGARLGATLAVGIADPDDDELDGWTLDPARYRDELATAVRARGLRLLDR